MRSINQKKCALVEEARREKGFTLIELSIVLVIIGLIIGGILTGQDLIKNAETKTIINEYNKIAVTINIFYGKYNCLPGDCYNISSYLPGELNGDGDEDIEPATGGNSNGETFAAWKHLSAAGLYPGTFSGLSGALNGGHAIVGTNIPGSKAYISAGYTFANLTSQSGSTTYYDGSYGNIIRLMVPQAASSVTEPILKPTQAYEIDKKIDDGIPGTGKFRTLLNVATYNWYCNTSSSAGSSPSSSAYDLSNNKADCRIMFLIGW